MMKQTLWTLIPLLLPAVLLISFQTIDGIPTDVEMIDCSQCSTNDNAAVELTQGKGRPLTDDHRRSYSQRSRCPQACWEQAMDDIFDTTFRGQDEMHAAKLFYPTGSHPWIRARNAKGETVLQYAVRRQNERHVQTLLDHPDVDPNEGQHSSPLQIAVASGNEGIVKALLQHPSIDPNVGIKDMLLTAIFNGRREIVKMLLDDPRQRLTAQQYQEIMMQALHRDLPMATIVATRLPTAMRGSSMLQAAVMGRIHLIQGFLDDLHVDMMYRDKVSGFTLYHIAAIQGDFPLLWLLFRRGNIPRGELLDDYQGQTPLHFAARANSVPVVRFLVERMRLDINAVSHAGFSPVWIAAKHNNWQVVEYLISRSTDLRLEDEDENSLLHIIAEKGSLSAAQVYARMGGDLEASNIHGETALALASLNGHLPVVRFLVSKTPSLLHQQDMDSRTAIIFAILGGHLNVVRYYVEEQKVPVLKLKDIDGNSALELAAQQDNNAMVRYLIDMKANVHDRNLNGETALSISAFMSHPENVRVLLEAGSELGAQGAHHTRPMATAISRLAESLGSFDESYTRVPPKVGIVDEPLPPHKELLVFKLLLRGCMKESCLSDEDLAAIQDGILNRKTAQINIEPDLIKYFAYQTLKKEGKPTDPELLDTITKWMERAHGQEVRKWLKTEDESTIKQHFAQQLSYLENRVGVVQRRFIDHFYRPGSQKARHLAAKWKLDMRGADEQSQLPKKPRLDSAE